MATGAHCLSAARAAAGATEPTPTIAVVVAAATDANPRNVWASSTAAATSLFDI